ncbi:MAG: LysM peptidoglycan-binding domain-containing protein, partial [Anaerolineae bacterium]|nr:LysM peptidoglycan-binding domain-containing protein [Anaerolineae bacterium]
MNKRFWILLIMLIAVIGTADAQDDETYRVRYGDTLDGIAQTRDISIACLAGANALTNANQLSYGQMLTIPADCDPYDEIELMIFSNVEDLTGNELLASGLGRGGGRAASAEATQESEADSMAAMTPEANTTTEAEATPEAAMMPTDEVYVVQKGDNLTKIAKKFEVTVACLLRANAIFNPDLIYTGQELLISAGCQAEGTADL